MDVTGNAGRATPLWVARLWVHAVPPPGRCLAPCCGEPQPMDDDHEPMLDQGGDHPQGSKPAPRKVTVNSTMEVLSEWETGLFLRKVPTPAWGGEEVGFGPWPGSTHPTFT